MRCNLCGSADNEIIFDQPRFEKINVLKCKNCGLVFLESGKTEKEIELFYEKSYRKVDTLPRKSAEEMFNDPVTRQDCKDRAEWIRKRYGNIEGKRILEIGSSSGYFLDTLASSGAEVLGVELTADYADYAKSLGFTVYTRPVEELDFKNEFDLVVSFHTLEHVFDPIAVLSAVRTALKERSGVFMGEVPNQDDWRLKIFDNYVVKRFHYDPFHNYYFSPVTLTSYLQKCSFSDIILETVERYNSLVQLTRILCGGYNQDSVEKVLKRDVFAQPEEDVRIPRPDNRRQTEFNRVFEKGVNSELMGNCLRWMAARGD